MKKLYTCSCLISIYYLVPKLLDLMIQVTPLNRDTLVLDILPRLSGVPK